MTLMRQPQPGLNVVGGLESTRHLAEGNPMAHNFLVHHAPSASRNPSGWQLLLDRSSNFTFTKKARSG